MVVEKVLCFTSKAEIGLTIARVNCGRAPCCGRSNGWFGSILEDMMSVTTYTRSMARQAVSHERAKRYHG